MRNIRSAGLAAALLVPLLGTAMTFEELSSSAYSRSLHKAESEGKRQALMYEKEALSSYDPITLEGIARKIGAEERGGNGMEYGMMVGFTARNPLLREAQKSQLDAAAESIEGMQALQKGRIRVALKHEYLLGELGKEAAAIAASKKALADEAHAIALKKHQAGRISQLELVRFETERSVAEKEHQEAKRGIQRHQDVLREMTMLDQEIFLDDLSFAFLAQPDTEREIRETPVQESFVRAEEELNRAIETLRRSRIESVNVGVGMTQEPTQNSIDLRLSVPLALSNKNEKKMAALMAQRSAVLHQKELNEQKLRKALEQSFRRLEELRGALETSVAVEKRHEALYGMAKKGFEGGVVSLFEYLETKNRFYAAKGETVRLKCDYFDEVAQTEEKLGGIWE